MSQALERWQSRAIWIVCHTDDEYPRRLKERLKEYAPPLIYGCGAPGVLNCGGLAVVGSRAADPWLIEYTEKVGQQAAESGTAIISGGARGIDQAAMRGALGIGGKAVGVMADSLERSALAREHRDLLLDEKLVLISPYDPLAGFNIGNAMQRNKLIYALADAALVVNSDYEKGGTWAGAVEQLEKLHLVPIYLRSSGDIGEGLQALSKRGALRWPNPNGAEEFIELINNADSAAKPEQLSLL
jgi:predicted Rossmann fold nucleotide-binding protein DprA/Smf involved in DNA uptake